VPTRLKGHSVVCPHCRKTFRTLADGGAAPAPAPPAAAPPPPSPGGLIRFACPACDRAMEVPADQAGTKLRCPSCRQRVQVPLAVDKTILGRRITFDNEPGPENGSARLDTPPELAPPPPGADGRRLVVLAGPDKDKTFPLPESGEVKVGRASGSDVRLLDVRVSRAHCRLEVSEDRVVLHAPEGPQTTYVNDQRVAGERVLAPGDEIRVGETRMRLEMPDVSGMKTVYGDAEEVRRLIAEAGKITVRCACGQELVARAKYAGTRVRCPACEDFVTLPGKLPRGQAAEPPPEPTPDSEPDSDAGPAPEGSADWRGASAGSAAAPGRLRSSLIALLVLAVLAALASFFLLKGVLWPPAPPPP
jgi:hypothetical protein